MIVAKDASEEPAFVEKIDTKEAPKEDPLIQRSQELQEVVRHQEEQVMEEKVHSYDLQDRATAAREHAEELVNAIHRNKTM